VRQVASQGVVFERPAEQNAGIVGTIVADQKPVRDEPVEQCGHRFAGSLPQHGDWTRPRDAAKGGTEAVHRDQGRPYAKSEQCVEMGIDACVVRRVELPNVRTAEQAALRSEGGKEQPTRLQFCW